MISRVEFGFPRVFLKSRVLPRPPGVFERMIEFVIVIVGEIRDAPESNLVCLPIGRRDRVERIAVGRSNFVLRDARAVEIDRRRSLREILPDVPV